MILVLGGLASGKRSYIESLGYTDDQIATRLDDTCPVLYGLEDILRETTLSEADLECLTQKEVVACAEVGSGVVPLDEEERAWREKVGRASTLLAERATRVIRIVAGIPIALK